MKSQTSQVARSCRIREQAAMVQECRNRPNGMSVDEWCRANNITKANYYYRFELKDISLIIVFPLFSFIYLFEVYTQEYSSVLHKLYLCIYRNYI